MARFTTASSFGAVVDFSVTPNHPYYTDFDEPTNVQRHCLPLVPNSTLGNFPGLPVVQKSPATFSGPQVHSFQDPPDISFPSPPSYLDFPSENIAHGLSFTIPILADRAPPYDIHHSASVYTHQANETTPVASLTSPLPAVSFPPFPYSALLTPPRFQNLPAATTSGSTQVGMQAPDYSTLLLPIVPDVVQSATASAPPVPQLPLAAMNSNIPHGSNPTCQCMIDGSPCNATLCGSTRFVRDHLKRDHAFYGGGKDTVRCPWGGCQDTLQRENIPRHIVSRHLRVKVGCTACGLLLSRRDVQYTHAKACPARRSSA